MQFVDRAYERGYDFCLLIPLDEAPSKPEWYPKNRIWISQRRWSNEATAAVIDARVQDAGGITREESLADRKARLERNVIAAERRKIFLQSESAVSPANVEVQRMFEEIEKTASLLSTKEFLLIVKHEREAINIKSYGFELHVYWHQPASNVLIDSCLYVRLIEIDRGDHFERKYHELKKLVFNFSLNESEEYGWDSTEGNKKFFSTKELTNFALQLLIDKVAEFRLKKKDWN